MKLELPDPSIMFDVISSNLVEHEYTDDTLIIQVMTEYSSLCVEYGAKSIRYQVIELLQNEGYPAFGESLVSIDDELIAKIHNLNP